MLEVDASGRRGRRRRGRLRARRFTKRVPRSRSTADGCAYESDELDGLVQVYVRSFPDGANKIRVSPAGARLPAWDSHGNLHYWQTPDYTMWAVHPTEKSGQLVVDTPQAVWRGADAPTLLRRIVTPLWGTGYDVDPGGARFLVLETAAMRSVPQLSHPMIVLDWAQPTTP